jgi:hypothetical protein
MNEQRHTYPIPQDITSFYLKAIGEMKPLRSQLGREVLAEYDITALAIRQEGVTDHLLFGSFPHIVSVAYCPPTEHGILQWLADDLGECAAVWERVESTAFLMSYSLLVAATYSTLENLLGESARLGQRISAAWWGARTIALPAPQAPRSAPSLEVAEQPISKKESEALAVQFLADLDDLLAKRPGRVSRGLNLLYREFDAWLMAGSFQIIREILSRVDVRKYNLSILVGFLTVTWKWKAALNERAELYEALRELVMAEAPKRAESILKGLE